MSSPRAVRDARSGQRVCVNEIEGYLARFEGLRERIAELTDGRMLVVEYKGADRYSNDDSREKRAIGEILPAYRSCAVCAAGPRFWRGTSGASRRISVGPGTRTLSMTPGSGRKAAIR